MVSAVSVDIARSHLDFGTASALPCASVIDSMATGVQKTPRLAKVAYALAIVSGESSAEPSAIDGASGSLEPSAGTTPSFCVISVTGQRPISPIISTKYVLMDFSIAVRSAYGPISSSVSFFAVWILPSIGRFSHCVPSHLEIGVG